MMSKNYSKPPINFRQDKSSGVPKSAIFPIARSQNPVFQQQKCNVEENFDYFVSQYKGVYVLIDGNLTNKFLTNCVNRFKEKYVSVDDIQKISLSQLFLDCYEIFLEDLCRCLFESCKGFDAPTLMRYYAFIWSHFIEVTMNLSHYSQKLFNNSSDVSQILTIAIQKWKNVFFKEDDLFIAKAVRELIDSEYKGSSTDTSSIPDSAIRSYEILGIWKPEKDSVNLDLNPPPNSVYHFIQWHLEKFPKAVSSNDQNSPSTSSSGIENRKRPAIEPSNEGSDEVRRPKRNSSSEKTEEFVITSSKSTDDESLKNVDSPAAAKRSRGRPRVRPNKDPVQKGKNEYMRNYHKKLVDNLEALEELVTLQDLAIRTLCVNFEGTDGMFDRMKEIKSWLNANRRPNSKLRIS